MFVNFLGRNKVPQTRWLSLTKYHKLYVLKQNHVLSQCSGDEKFEIKASRGLAPSGRIHSMPVS